MIDLLVNFDEAKDILESNVPEYLVSPDSDVMSFYERPYLETFLQYHHHSYNAKQDIHNLYLRHRELLQVYHMSKYHHYECIPKQNGEIRIVACDMAFIERSNKNDNSCFTCIRALPESIHLHGAFHFHIPLAM